MKNTITLREIILFSICLFLTFYSFNKKRDNEQIIEDKIRAEERIKQYQQESKLQYLISDSISQKNKSLEAIIEYQKKNPKIIIEKYDKIRNNINLLNADESISYLSNQLSKESDNR